MNAPQTLLETSDCNLTLSEKIVRIREIIPSPIDEKVLKNEIIKFGFKASDVRAFQSIVETNDKSWCLLLLLIKHLGDDNSECWNIVYEIFRGCLSVYQKIEMMEYILSGKSPPEQLSIIEYIKLVKNHIKYCKQQIKKDLRVSRWELAKSLRPDITDRMAIVKCEAALETEMRELKDVVWDGPPRKRGRPPKVNPIFIHSPTANKPPPKKSMHKKMKITHSSSVSPIQIQTPKPSTPVIQPYEQNNEPVIQFPSSSPVQQTHEKNNTSPSSAVTHKEPVNTTHEPNNPPLIVHTAPEPMATKQHNIHVSYNDITFTVHNNEDLLFLHTFLQSISPIKTQSIKMQENPNLIQQLYDEVKVLKNKMETIDTTMAVSNKIDIVMNKVDKIDVVMNKVDKIDKDVSEQTMVIKKNEIVARSQWGAVDRKLDDIRPSSAPKFGSTGAQNQVTNELSQRGTNRLVEPLYNSTRIPVK